MFLPLGSNLPFFKVPKVTVCWVTSLLFIYVGVTQREMAQIEASSLDFSYTLSSQLAVYMGKTNSWWQFFSYQFFHASFGHVLSNIWYLLIFGWILENAIGGPAFFLLSILAGAAAVMPELLVASHQPLPIVGASGAVAFMLGASAFMFPKSKIKLLFLLIPLPKTPASFFVPLRYLIYFWLFMQASGLAMQYWMESRPVAYTTHLTGFFIGAVVGGIYWLRFRKEKFVNVDLSGRDLKSFYRGMDKLEKGEVEGAERILCDLSDSHPWFYRFQEQVFQFALDYKRKKLADHVWRNLFPLLLSSARKSSAEVNLKAYQESFGLLPVMHPEQRIQLARLLKWKMSGSGNLQSQAL